MSLPFFKELTMNKYPIESIELNTFMTSNLPLIIEVSFSRTGGCRYLYLVEDLRELDNFLSFVKKRELALLKFINNFNIIQRGNLLDLDRFQIQTLFENTDSLIFRNYLEGLKIGSYLHESYYSDLFEQLTFIPFSKLEFSDLIGIVPDSNGSITGGAY